MGIGKPGHISVVLTVAAKDRSCVVHIVCRSKTLQNATLEAMLKLCQQDSRRDQGVT